METIVCQTCGAEKGESKFVRRGLQKKPALCRACYAKRPEQRDRCKKNMQNYRANLDFKKKESDAKRVSYQKKEVNERYKQYSKEYRKTPQGSISEKKYQNRRTEQAYDSYIKSCICKKTQGILKAREIPEQLIEIERQSLILKRTIKQKQKEDEQHNTTTDL